MEKILEKPKFKSKSVENFSDLNNEAVIEFPVGKKPFLRLDTEALGQKRIPKAIGKFMKPIYLIPIILLMALPISYVNSDSLSQPSMRTQWVAEHEQIAAAINFPELLRRIRNGDTELMRYIDFLTYQKFMQVLLYERDRLRSDPNYLDAQEHFRYRQDISIYQVIGFSQPGPIISFFYGVANTDPRIRKRAFYHVHEMVKQYHDYDRLPLNQMKTIVSAALDNETVPLVYEALDKMKILINRLILTKAVKQNPSLLRTMDKSDFRALSESLDDQDNAPILLWDENMLDALFAGLQNKYLYVKLHCVVALKHIYRISTQDETQRRIRLELENLLLFIDELDLYLGARLAEEVATGLDLQPMTPDRRVRLPQPDVRYQRSRSHYDPNEAIYGFGNGTFYYQHSDE